MSADFLSKAKAGFYSVLESNKLLPSTQIKVPNGFLQQDQNCLGQVRRLGQVSKNSYKMLFTNFGALVLALGPRPESNVEQFLITESSVAKQHKTDFKLFYLTQKMYLVNMFYKRFQFLFLCLLNTIKLSFILGLLGPTYPNTHIVIKCNGV